MIDKPQPRKGGGAPAESPAQEGALALLFVAEMAAAPAQRPLCRARQARGLALARGLQAAGDRRQAEAAQARPARGRPRRRAGRLEPDRRPASEGHRGTRQGGRYRPPGDRPHPRRRLRPARLPQGRGTRSAQADARRRGRRRAVRHGGQHHRPQGDRPSAHRRIGRTRHRLRPAGALARRRLRRQGVPGRHREHAAGRAQARLHHGAAHQAAGEPGGFRRALCGGDRLPRPAGTRTRRRCPSRWASPPAWRASPAAGPVRRRHRPAASGRRTASTPRSATPR